MNPIRHELLNGLFVLVVASLLSAAFAAFQVSFNIQLWVWIIIGIAIALGFYVVFELTLRFAVSSAELTRQREEEWLKRVGHPARLELSMSEETGAIDVLVEAVKTIRPGSDFTIMLYIGPEGGGTLASDEFRERLYGTIIEQLKRGTIREYKRIMCFDHDLLASDQELRSGIVRVGEGPGTIARRMGEHCRQIMDTKGCSQYVAPVVLRNVVGFYGTDKVSMSVETAEPASGTRRITGTMIFYDPPNGEIIEQFRQLERATERRMVAVHKIVFPEDEVPTEALVSR
jgi:hypothetical protein